MTPAITTGGDGTPYGPYYAPMIPYNPHIKYYEGDRRGYFKATVTPRQMRLDLRFVTSVENPSRPRRYTRDRGWWRTACPARCGPDEPHAGSRGCRSALPTRQTSPAPAAFSTAATSARRQAHTIEHHAFQIHGLED